MKKLTNFEKDLKQNLKNKKFRAAYIKEKRKLAKILKQKLKD